MPLVKAQCTNCGAALEVDPSKEAAICPFCNTPYIVEKAINNYITNVTNNIQAQNVTIVGGKDFNQIFNSAKNLLGVSHKQGLEACNEALSLQPTNYEVWVLLAKYYVNDSGKLEIDAIKKAIELTPPEKIADVSKDLISYLIEFRKRVCLVYLDKIELAKDYLFLTGLKPEDSVQSAMEIMSILHSDPGSFSKFAVLQNASSMVQERCNRDFEKCSQEFKNDFAKRTLSSGALCKGAEQTIFSATDVLVWLIHNGKIVNKSGFFSPLNGIVTLTNYNISYNTNNPKTSFSKSLDNLCDVTMHMKIMIKLVFSDGYEVQIPSPSKTMQDTTAWVNRIKSILY